MALATLVLWSCGSDDSTETPSPAVAAFTATVDGLNVTVRNTTAEAFTEAVWNFGDESEPVTNNSTEDVVYTYAESGEYTISLTVTSEGGTTLTTNMVTIAAPGSADFTASVEELVVTVQNTTAGEFTSAEWDFGDGSDPVENNSTDPVEYTYAENGDYTITLTVVNAGGTTTKEETVTIVSDVFNRNGNLEGGEEALAAFWTLSDGAWAGASVDFELADAPEGGSGKALRVFVEIPTETSFHIETVNEVRAEDGGGGAGFPVDTDNFFRLSVRIHADQAGRKVFLAAGGPAPNFGDYDGSTVFENLDAGWNDLEITTGARVDQLPDALRGTLKYSYPENEGAVFFVDDMVMEIIEEPAMTEE